MFIVTANTAPIAVTKIIPASFNPIQSSASGTHAIDGMDWSPNTKEPIVWFTTSTLAIKIPRKTPIASAMVSPITNLIRVVQIPKNKLPSDVMYTKLSPTSYGDGKL